MVLSQHKIIKYISRDINTCINCFFLIIVQRTKPTYVSHLPVNNYKCSLMYYCDYWIHYNGWIYIQVIYMSKGTKVLHCITSVDEFHYKDYHLWIILSKYLFCPILFNENNPLTILILNSVMYSRIIFFNTKWYEWYSIMFKTASMVLKIPYFTRVLNSLIQPFWVK